MGENSHGQDIFQDRLRRARQIRGLQQGELALKAGLPPASISHFENGTRKPSFDNLRRLSQALDVSADFLLGRVDQVDLGAASDPLYRHVENLSADDRGLAEELLKVLAAKSRKDKEGG